MSSVEYPATVYHALLTYSFGYQLNWCLYGILVVQVYLYHTARYADKVAIKILVYGTFLLETLQIAIATRDSYYQLVLSYGEATQVAQVYLTWFSIPVLVGIIGLIVQIFYAYMIYVLSNGPLLACSIALLAVTQAASAFAAAAIMALQNSSTAGDTITNATKAATVWLSLGVACDLVICLSMTYIWVTQPTNMPKSKVAIKRLFNLIAGTGLAPALCALLSMIVLVVYKHAIFYEIAAVILSKLYSNSMVAVLNSRRIVSSNPDSVTTTSLQVNCWEERRNSSGRTPSARLSLVHAPKQENHLNSTDMFSQPLGDVRKARD